MAEQLDPATVDRVLRRAHALSDPVDVDEEGGVDASTLVAAASEVGIPAEAVRRSLAIERLGPLPRTTPADRWAGPGLVVEQRVVGREPADVLERVDRWLTSGHQLRRERRWANRMEWTRRHDAAAAVRRRLRHWRGEGRLGNVSRIVAEVTPVDSGDPTNTFTVLRLTVDRTPDRRAQLLTGSTVAGAGVAGTAAALTVLAPPVLILSVPAIVGGGWIATRGRLQTTTAAGELARLVDAVEDGDRPDSLRAGMERVLPGRGRRVAATDRHADLSS